VLHFLDDPAAAIAEAARLLAPGGRLLVVDFAPHELEFLREQSAHRRLGFARDQLARLFESSGLKLERFRELKTAASGGKLTVSLWLGVKPATAAKKRKANAKVEAAA
jgi:ubiquinone/menaquinone biosynthesis C-methylase UbiE